MCTPYQWRSRPLISHQPPAQGRREQRLQFLSVLGAKFIGLVRQHHEVRPLRERLLDRRPWITFASRRVDVVEADHPQHVVRIGVGVEGHPRVLPDGAEDAEAQLGPDAEPGFRFRSPPAQSRAPSHRPWPRRPKRRAKLDNRLDRGADLARIGGEYHDTGGAQLLDILAPILLGVGDHEVRRKFSNRFKIRILGPANLGHCRGRRRRLNAVMRHPRDRVPQARARKASPSSSARAKRSAVAGARAPAGNPVRPRFAATPSTDIIRRGRSHTQRLRSARFSPIGANTCQRFVARLKL